MSFRLEESDGVPRAVFEDEDPLRRALLPLLLHPAQYFVPDMLYELSIVERGVTEYSGFDTPHAEVLFYRDRVVIETPLPKERDGDEPDRLELTVDEAKLLLLEWGVALQQRHLERKNAAQAMVSGGRRTVEHVLEDEGEHRVVGLSADSRP